MAKFALSEEQFNKAFEKAVTKTLLDLGTSVQTAVMFHLERIQGLSTSELLKDPNIFSAALQKIFANGSKILEEKVIQVMCRDLGIEYERTWGSFAQKLTVVQNAASDKRTALVLN